LIFIEAFIGIETSLDMHEAHSESLMETGESQLGGFGIGNNFIRAYFGPFAFRNFLDERNPQGMLQNAHYLLFLFYPYIAVRATLIRAKFGVAIFFTILYSALLIPFHTSFKILMYVFFGGLFLAPLINLSSRTRGNLSAQKKIDSQESV